MKLRPPLALPYGLTVLVLQAAAAAHAAPPPEQEPRRIISLAVLLLLSLLFRVLVAPLWRALRPMRPRIW